MFTAIRLRKFAILSCYGNTSRGRNVVEGEQPTLNIIIFHAVSAMNEKIDFISNILEENENNNTLYRKKTKLLDCSSSIAGSAESILKLVDDVHKVSTSENKIECFVSDLRKELNDTLGNLWHVVAAKLGDIQFAYPKLPEDDYPDVFVAGKIRVIAFRYTFTEKGLFTKFLFSPAVWLFFTSICVFFVWFHQRSCSPAPCSLDLEPCSLEDAQLYVDKCTKDANVYFMAIVLIMFLSFLTRRTEDMAKRSKRKQVLHTNKMKNE